jgi:hypothetical protein
MLFHIPFLADWKKVGDYMQRQTDLNTQHENKSHHDWDYQDSDKVLIWKDGILRASESYYEHDPWTRQFIQMAQLGFNTELNQNY